MIPIEYGGGVKPAQAAMAMLDEASVCGRGRESVSESGEQRLAKQSARWSRLS
jgi:hypothetical protein